MKVELRKRIYKDNITFHYDLILIPNKKESKLLDLIDNKVKEDGFICNLEGQIRLSDGYGEHYIWVSKTLNLVRDNALLSSCYS